METFVIYLKPTSVCLHVSQQHTADRLCLIMKRPIWLYRLQWFIVELEIICSHTCSTHTQPLVLYPMVLIGGWLN